MYFHKTIIVLNTMGLSLFLTSCFQAVSTTQGQSTLRNGQSAELLMQTQATTSGGVVASLSSQSLSTQTVQAATVKNSAASFPPGSLSIDTSITLEEGASLATDASLAEIGMSTPVTQSGTAITISSSASVDATQPFQLSLPLPTGASLNLDDPWANLVVMYKVTKAAEQKNEIGVLPRSAITIKDGLAQISTQYFGSFQTAITQTPVTQKIAAETNTLIVTKQDLAKLPAITISGRAPFMVQAGGVVTIKGVNFRPTMVIAMGGSKVQGLKVASDSVASFTVPASGSFGLTSVAVEQDGVAQSISVFYTGDKTDLPVITMPVDQVCIGIKYYDASGTIRSGNRDCAAQASTVVTTPDPNLIAENIKAGITIKGVTGTYTAAAATPPANCSADGQAGCLTTTSFPAASLASLNPWNIRSGVTIGGVPGKILFNFGGGYDDSYIGRITGPGATTGLDIYETIDDLFASSLNPIPGHDYSQVIIEPYAPSTDTFIDHMTNRKWTIFSTGIDHWEEAITDCSNGSNSSFASGWRLPTQKEMMQAYIDGLMLNVAPDINTLAAGSFWTATSSHNDPGMAAVFTVGNSISAEISKATSSSAHLCVHD